MLWKEGQGHHFVYYTLNWTARSSAPMLYQVQKLTLMTERGKSTVTREKEEEALALLASVS